MLQNGMVTDCNVASNSFNCCMYMRILKYDTTTGNVVAQYAYRLDGAGPAPAQGRVISAIVALDENRFMVLERNYRGVGVSDANLSSPDKKVYIIDISGANDVSAINLNTNTLPSGVKSRGEERLVPGGSRRRQHPERFVSDRPRRPRT